jgi:hypothetical protein
VIVWVAGVSWNDCVCDGGFSVYVELFTLDFANDGDIEEVCLIIFLFFQGRELCFKFYSKRLVFKNIMCNSDF